MSDLKKFSLLKPTLQTPFHVDFEWWRANDNNWHIALHEILCPEHQASFADLLEGQMIDYVDPETAEVRPMDYLQTTLISHCAKQEDFLDPHTMLVEAVFRLFLANGNAPMTSQDLGKLLNRPADVILKTISGPRVYKGLRPYNP